MGSPRAQIDRGHLHDVASNHRTGTRTQPENYLPEALCVVPDCGSLTARLSCRIGHSARFRSGRSHSKIR